MTASSHSRHPSLAAPSEAIDLAEAKLQVAFPEALRQVWLTSNGLDLRSGWTVHSVFDRTNPRRSSNDIVTENTSGRWEYRSRDLCVIASNGTGNALVLRRAGASLKPEVYLWNHETNRTQRSRITLETILKEAQARVVEITRLRERYSKERA